MRFFARHPFFFILLMASCLWACQREKAADEFLIEGQIEHYANKRIALDRMEGNVVTPLDSVMTDAEGRFQFFGKTQANTLHQLRTPDRKNILLVPSNLHLQIKADYAANLKSEIEGDPMNAQLSGYRNEQTRLYSTYLDKHKAMSRYSRETNLEGWRRAEAATDTSLLAYQAFLKTFMDTVSYPMLRAVAAMSYTGKDDFYRLQKLSKRVEAELPGHPIARTLKERTEKELKSFFAIEVPDFNSYTSTGDSLKLSATRGKVVLLYVWASYCEYSRRENQRLRELLQGRENPDFVLIDYSIDEDRAAWTAALQADSLPAAHHLLSPGGWTCPPVNELGVRSIPFTYLLDARGILRTKNIFAPDLAEDLDSLVQLYKAR